MTEIAYLEAARQVRTLEEGAEPLLGTGPPDLAIDAVQALLDHPCAYHEVVVAEWWDELHRLLRQEGRYDEAIAAKRSAIAAGYQSRPDPEADVAECLLEAGRVEEAEALFVAIRDRDPDDVWLYNSAGLTYDEAGDPTAASRWLTEGLEVAMTTGDEDQVAPQLWACLQDLLAAQGATAPADLAGRVEAFIAAWRRPDQRRSVFVWAVEG